MILLAPQNAPFTVALGVLVCLVVLEVIGAFVAASPSSFLDHLAPDLDHVDGPLGWLHIGKVPLLALLALFLAGFGITGFMLQMFLASSIGLLAPAAVACVPAFAGGIFSLKCFGGILGKVIPKDETYVIRDQDLIGRVATVCGGNARRGLGSEARVLDVYQKRHFVLVEPDDDHQVLSNGTQVLLVRQANARYFAIPNPHPDIL